MITSQQPIYFWVVERRNWTETHSVPRATCPYVRSSTGRRRIVQQIRDSLSPIAAVDRSGQVLPTPSNRRPTIADRTHNHWFQMALWDMICSSRKTPIHLHHHLFQLLFQNKISLTKFQKVPRPAAEETMELESTVRSMKLSIRPLLWNDRIVQRRNQTLSVVENWMHMLRPVDQSLSGVLRREIRYMAPQLRSAKCQELAPTGNCRNQHLSLEQLLECHSSINYRLSLAETSWFVGRLVGDRNRSTTTPGRTRSLAHSVSRGT